MPRFFSFSMLAAIAALPLLSGCGVYHEMVGKPRPGTKVVGSRHIPIENQQDLAKQAMPAPLTAPPLAAPDSMLPPPPDAEPPQGAAMPAPVNPADADPYDYYDKQGHPVAPKTTAHVPSPQSSLIMPDNDDEAMRKLLPDNRYTPADMQTAQALPSQDISMPPAVVASRKASPAASPSPSFFTRIFGGGQDTQLSAADRAAEKAPYPALSSVPPTPPELQSERVVNPQGMQQLESDWQAAQQNKQALDAEPSSLPPPQAAVNTPDAAPASN